MTKLLVDMSVDEENKTDSNGSQKPYNPERSREWFGVQLEVINLLLEAERRKLCVLQRELKTALEEGGSIKAKEHQKQELITAIQKIQLQYDNLEKECRQHAIGALKASNTRGIGKNFRETVASKNPEKISTRVGKDLKLDNLESAKEKLPERSIQNGCVSEAAPSLVKGHEGKAKPPVPPKRSTLTYGKSYVSVSDSNAPSPSSTAFSLTVSLPPSKEYVDEPCQTSQVVTVTTNLLSTTPKGLPTPRSKNQPILSTFLPALPPKFCKSPLSQSPNFPVRTHNLETKKPGELERISENQKGERRVSEKDSTSPSSISSSKTQSSSASNSLDKEIARDDTDSVRSSAENTPNKTGQQKEFSQSPPLESPPKPPRKAPVAESTAKKKPSESSPPSLKSSPLPLRKSPSLNLTSDTPRIAEAESKDDLALNVKKSSAKHRDEFHDFENNPPHTLYLEDSNEKTNTIKRAPSSDQKNADSGKERLSTSGVKLRPKSPIKVSFARKDKDDTDVKIYEKLSRTKRATKELKNIIHQIEYTESDYCSDDNCRSCVVRKTSSLSRRRSASPKTTFFRSVDLVEGYTSCCEEGTRTISKKTKSLTRKKSDQKSGITYNRVLCNCPLDNLVIDNRVPLSRPNSSIGDYCTQPSRSKSAVRAKKNSGSGIKTPFLSASSKVDFDRPGLGLIVTISSDGIDKEPKRTVQFISGGPAINFGLGGTLGRYTKSKSQDKGWKIAGNGFHVDHAPGIDDITEWAKFSSKSKADEKEEAKKSQIKEETTQEILNAQKPNSNDAVIPPLERQKSAGELRRPRSSRAADDYKQRYLNSLSKKKSPGEVLEHFGKLATSVTTSEISKISDEKKKSDLAGEDSVKGHIKTFEKISKSGNSSHSFENYRTVPPTSFNNPDPYLGSAFVQYVRETLPYQPNSFPGGANTGSAFNKYIRPGSGRFDKSLIFPQQPKSDKPSAFERLCGDKIYASKRGVYGKVPPQNQNVSGSLDCVWGKQNPNEPPKVNESEADSTGKEIRPASCTYEINKGRIFSGPPPSSGPYLNYSIAVPATGGKTLEYPRTSKKGIIETEASTNQPQLPSSQACSNPKASTSSKTAKSGPPQYFNPRSLENYKLAPGFKTDLSTLYSGVFYTNPKQDSVSSKLSTSSRILYEYGLKSLGTTNRGSKAEGTVSNISESMGLSSSSTGRASSVDLGASRKLLTGGISAAMAASTRIPEEAAVGTMAIFLPQYHPKKEELMQENQQSNRSQPAIGLKQTPKSRPTIFGTVASDQIPKDGSSRRGLPQTTLGSSNGGLTEYSSSLESVQESTPEKDIALVYRDGNLVSGSMEGLIQHMVPTSEYYPDRAYLFAFLLSSRLFIKPHELLGEVCALCDSQQHLGVKDPPSRERLGRFIPHFVQLLAEWTETFPYDFRDERVMVHVRNITQKCVTVDPSIRKEVSTLLQNLLVRLTTLEKYEEFLMRISAENSTDCLEGLNSTDVTELCASPGLLAQQLTHIELERLSYIGPEEFVQAFAKENPNLGTSFKDMKKTRNLESYVSWFNRLSYLVATDVCKHMKKKQRVRVMEYWIETARECFNIGNFNSLMAIIAGLNMSPVARLKKTWSKIQSGKFSVLEHQMDPSSNFSSYRSTLKAAMWRSAGATDQRQRIVIPFFSLLVKDLYFLNEGCSNKLPNGHINFEKFWQLAKQVTEFITWKQVACPFDKCTKVITFLQASPVLTENALALASFECEQPENNHEKERYKSLK